MSSYSSRSKTGRRQSALARTNSKQAKCKKLNVAIWAAGSESPNSLHSSHTHTKDYIWFCLRAPKAIVELHNFIPKWVTFAHAKLKQKMEREKG